MDQAGAGGGGGDSQSTPQNVTPDIVNDVYGAVVSCLQNYGWFLLFGLVAVLFLRSKLQPYFEDWLQKRQEQQEYARYKQDPDLVRQRQEGQEAARRRMQEVYDAQAAKYAEEQKERNERKRQEKIEDWDRHLEGKGYRSKIKNQDTDQRPGASAPKPPKKNVYRSSDYNPLTGTSGSGNSYRPSRPSRGGGGG